MLILNVKKKNVNKILKKFVNSHKMDKKSIDKKGIYMYVCAYLEGMSIVYGVHTKRIEYVLEWNLVYPLDMNLFSPFQPESEFKVYRSCKCSQIICRRMHYYSMFPRQSISISNFLKL